MLKRWVAEFLNTLLGGFALLVSARWGSISAPVMIKITLLLASGLLLVSGRLVAEEAELEKWLTQLGSDSFAERIGAQEALKNALVGRPKEVLPVLKEELGKSEDAEVRSSLKRLLKGYYHGIPIKTYKFDEASYQAGDWKLVQTGKGQGPKFLKDGSVEINANGIPGGALFFSRPIGAENAKHLTVFEAKVKIVEPGAGGYCAILTLEDNLHGESLVIDSKGLSTYNRGGEKVDLQNAGVWRTYRIEGLKNQLRVFVDGAQKPVMVRPWTRHPRAAPENQVRFGDTGSRSAAHVLYKDISVKIYPRG